MCIGRAPADVLEEAVELARDGASHLIFVILASDGPEGLLRLSREVVIPLRHQVDG